MEALKLLDKKELSSASGVDVGAVGQVCPKCGAGRLFREQLSDGRAELVCLNQGCDYQQLLPESESKEVSSDSFPGRVERMSDDQLRVMQKKLSETSETLRGRSARLARQQLGIVQAELARRVDSMGLASSERPETMEDSSSAGSPKVPPQFNTPQATARRIEGIRNYHRRQQAERIKSLPLMPSETQIQSGATMGLKATHWLDRLLKTLRDEAMRHEQAARNYSRVPELFPLHIEHQARAFELNRVLDLLDNYADMINERDGGM
jgi:hypothetical protein